MDFYTTADAPKTLRRRIRTTFTGTPLTQKEQDYGYRVAGALRSEALHWRGVGAPFENPAQDKILMETPLDILAEHMAVQRILEGN